MASVTACWRWRPRVRPRWASTRGARAALRSKLADRSRAGQDAIAAQLRADLARPRRSTRAALQSHATRTTVEVVKSAYRIALDGFALPYGDVAVGGWRNTPYVVIQNVGAYLDARGSSTPSIRSRPLRMPRPISPASRATPSTSTASWSGCRRPANRG